MRIAKETAVYIDGGNNCLGIKESHKLSYWLEYGRKHNQKYLYKGYRWYNNKSDSVVVFDTKRWDGEEINRRKYNGFLGIREYIL